MNATRAATLLVITTLAACTAEPAYPTEVRRVPRPGGKIAELYGAPVADVCEAIADAACAGATCRGEFISRCDRRTGRIEATTLEGWDALWSTCLAGVAELDGYTGTEQPAACVLLTPNWS